MTKRLSRNNVKASGYSEAPFMSCQHLQKHVCCGRMRADLRDACKMPLHRWSIGPGGAALVFPASDFWDWSTGEIFFPERVSLHALWKLDLAKGCHILQCEEKPPMEKHTFGIRSDEVSIWCVFILWTEITQSSFSLTMPFVWKPCWSSSFTCPPLWSRELKSSHGISEMRAIETFFWKPKIADRNLLKVVFL